jgi:capsule polysaccharide export protein KpsE/RkpR
VPGGVKTPFLPTLYASIISSRKIRRQILDEFKLQRVFGDTTEQALEMLRQRTFLKYTDEGIFLVGYEDRDRKRAADVVNAYLKHLDELIQQVNSGRAGSTRRFIEGQIARCHGELEHAENTLKDFQRDHHAVQIDTQTENALGLAAELEAKILSAEIELGVLEQRALPASFEVRSKKEQLDALRNKYAELTQSDPKLLRPREGRSSLFPPFDTVPDLALQYGRLLRDMRVQETLYMLLLQQLEQARIEEQKNTPVISVLDWAEPSDKPVYPKKTLLVVLAAAAAFVWVMLVAVLVEKLRERRADAQEAARLAALRDEWRRLPGWVRRIERLVVR